jgi:hypothetical protein
MGKRSEDKLPIVSEDDIWRWKTEAAYMDVPDPRKPEGTKRVTGSIFYKHPDGLYLKNSFDDEWPIQDGYALTIGNTAYRVRFKYKGKLPQFTPSTKRKTN